jgi:uncharacterized membrane protein YphA (DoxX/SURF4 family)
MPSLSSIAIFSRPAQSAPERASALQPGAWTSGQRILFRFTFVFIGMYTMMTWRSYWLWGAPGALLYQNIIVKPAVWLGVNAWGICTSPGAVRYYDPYYCWVNDLIFLGIASGLVAVIWTLLDRRRRHYRKLHEALRVFVRYYLGYIMFMYATMKFAGMQFSGGYVGTRLQTTVGEMAPRDLMWWTMGVSAIYGHFTALGETVGGFLMFWRRTTSLGAIVNIMILASITVLDIVHQVSISERALMYGVMSFFLLAPDIKRLANLYLFNRPIPPPAPDVEIIDRNRWPAWRVAAPIVKLVVMVPLIGSSVQFMVRSLPDYFLAPPAHMLVGVYSVEGFMRNHSEVPAAFADSTRWRFVELAPPTRDTANTPPGTLRWITMTGGDSSVRVKLDTVKNSFTLFKGFQGDTIRGVLGLARIEGVKLRLTGTLDRDTIDIVLRKLEDDSSVAHGGPGHFPSRKRHEP